MVSPAIANEEALVVPGRTKRHVSQIDGRERGVRCAPGILDAHSPRPISSSSGDEEITAELNHEVSESGLAQDDHGTIDRVDRHLETGAVLLLDYKTGDSARTPEENHCVLVDGRREWTDLQLPLYALLAREGGIGPETLHLAYVNLPKQLGKTGVSIAGWTAAEIEEAHDRARLVEVYAGNPLALNIVAQTIVELFGGEIAPFLQQGEVIFGSVRELLDEQFARLSAGEQTVLLWLAILREPVSLDELRAVLVTPLTRAQVSPLDDRRPARP